MIWCYPRLSQIATLVDRLKEWREKEREREREKEREQERKRKPKHQLQTRTQHWTTPLHRNCKVRQKLSERVATRTRAREKRWTESQRGIIQRIKEKRGEERKRERERNMQQQHYVRGSKSAHLQ